MSSLPSTSSYADVRYTQNFLKDSRLVAMLLDRSSISREDVVYEIGPGKGIITEQLALRSGHVIAIEKDPCLAARLRRKFTERPNVTIHAGDFLEYRSPCRRYKPCKPYKVFANIPFNCTAAIVTKLTTTTQPPEDAYLAMQQEAADMFLGRPRESLRSVLLKPWFALEIAHRFRRSDFLPAPRVDVVMLRLRKRGPPLVNTADRQCFRDFVTHIFTARQPSLDYTLKHLFTSRQHAHIRCELGIDGALTPTSLSFAQWLDLFSYCKTIRSEHAMQVISGSEQRLIHQQKRIEKMHRTRLASKRQ